MRSVSQYDDISGAIRRADLARKPLCERCRYDEADPTQTIADCYQDWFQAVCWNCAKELHRLQAARDPGDPPDLDR